MKGINSPSRLHSPEHELPPTIENRGGDGVPYRSEQEEGGLGTSTQALRITPPLPQPATSCYHPKCPHPWALASIPCLPFPTIIFTQSLPKEEQSSVRTPVIHSENLEFALEDSRFKSERAAERLTRARPRTHHGELSGGTAATAEAAAGRGRPGPPSWPPQHPPGSPSPARPCWALVDAPLVSLSGSSDPAATGSRTTPPSRLRTLCSGPPLPRDGKSRGKGEWEGGLGCPGEVAEGSA